MSGRRAPAAGASNLPRVREKWENVHVTLTANEVAPATAAKPSRDLTDQLIRSDR